MRAYERFLNYIKINTTADPNSGLHPSSLIQKNLGKLLVQELKELGVIDAYLDQYGYVYGTVPANTNQKIDTIAFIAHMDTSPDASGENVKARIIKNYDGNDIVLNHEKNIIMKSQDFVFLKSLTGQSLIVTDGTTLLGADDKAGIAEIMTMIEYLNNHPEIKHGKINIVFTPDEEIGEGPMFFNYSEVDAKFAYTVDGGKEGIINYENFNAASCHITINGNNIHPGSAKNLMVNSILIAMEFNHMLPKNMIPAATEMYEGFYHLNNIEGNVEKTLMHYLIRNHDINLFNHQKEQIMEIQKFLNFKYGKNTVEVTITDSYYNMKEIVQKHMDVVEIAKKATVMSGIKPEIYPIRGGTDGAQLTYNGLICPNLGTGGWNAHGKFECITIEAMDKCCEILVNIVKIVAQ